MNRRLLAVCFVLLSLALTTPVSNAQPQALVDRFEERVFNYTGGRYQNAEIRYRLHVPERIQSGRRYPLIIHLHGVGEAGACNRHSLLYLDSIMPLMDRQDFFMLVTQCPRDERHWFFRPTQDGTLDVLVAIMEHVIAENPIDRRRITATGVSSGGWGVWELALRHPDLLAGAVPTACSAPRQLQRLATLTQTPIWVIVNSGDRAIDFESNRMAMGVINRAGGSMAVTEHDASGHNAWIPAMTTYNCFQWMLAQRRGSWFAPPPGTVVHDEPRSLLMVFLLYILPLSIIAFLAFMSWGTICETVREWLGWD